MVVGEAVACGVCWHRRGSKRLFNDVGDLSRHATLAHPNLGYVPVKRLRVL